MTRAHMRLPRSASTELRRSGLIARARPIVSLPSAPRHEQTIMSGIPLTDTLCINAWGSPETYGTFGQPCGGYRVYGDNGHSQELMLGAANSNGFVRVNFDGINPGPALNPAGVAMNEKLWNGKMAIDSPGSLRTWVTVPAVAGVMRTWNGARPDGFVLAGPLTITFIVSWAAPPVSASMYDLCVCRANTVTLRGLPPGGSVRVTVAGTLVPPPVVVPIDGLGVAVWDGEFSIWSCNIRADVYDGPGATGALLRAWEISYVFGGDIYESQAVP